MLVAALVGGASALALSPPSAGARLSMRLGGATTSLPQQQQQQQQGLHMTSVPGSGSGLGSGSEGQQGRNALPTSRRDVLGAVFGVAASSFAFVAAADAKVCVCRLFSWALIDFAWQTGIIYWLHQYPGAGTTSILVRYHIPVPGARLVDVNT